MRRAAMLLAASDRVYRTLLWAYPADFRRTYGADMAQVFRDGCRDAIARDGVAGLIELWLHTLADLVGTALKERVTAAAKRGKATIYAQERRSTMPLFSKPARVKTSLDTFTKRATYALQLATEEARALNHGYIGTEHLLLGLLRERKGVSGEVLNNLGVSLDQARGTAQSLVGVGKQPPPEVQPLSKRAVQAIDRAIDEARLLDHKFVGTEHLLLGIVETNDGAAAGVLKRLGLTAGQVRAEVLRVLAQR